MERNAAGVVTGRHPCYQFRALDERYWVRSRAIRDESSHKYVPLRDETGNVLQRADHFRVLRLHAPWSIPMFAGILPQTPDEDSSLLEEAKWALFTMFLFRPWRRPLLEARAWITVPPRTEDPAPCYQAIWTEYERWWKDDVAAVACPYCTGDIRRDAWPKYSTHTEIWWTCLVWPKLQQWYFAMKRVQNHRTPTVLHEVPVASDDDDHSLSGSRHGSGIDSDQGDDDAVPAEADGRDEGVDAEVPASKTCSKPDAFKCTFVPHMNRGHDFYLNPPALQSRSAEAYFGRGFQVAATQSGLNVLPSEEPPFLPQPFISDNWGTGESTTHATAALKFFRHLDTATTDMDNVLKSSTACNTPFQAQMNSVRQSFTTLKTIGVTTQHSFTIVLESALWLIHSGVLNVKDEPVVNVKQARSLVHVAT